MKTFCLSMLATAALLSCSNESIMGDDNLNSSKDKAFMSLAIHQPTTSPSRAAAAPGTAVGAGAEVTIATVAYICFDAVGGKTANGMLENPVAGTPTTSAPFGVPGTTKSVFVVVNPSAAIQTAITNAATFTALKSVLDVAVADVTATGGFTMSNSEGLVPVTLADSEGEATAAKTTVNVDRLVAKVNLKPFPATANAKITDFALNTTNKSTLLYAEYMPYNFQEGGAGGDVVANNESYRVDANFSKLVMDANGTGTAAAAFNWLSNNPTAVPAWITVAAETASTEGVSYCLENTIDGVAHTDNNNITAILLKAVFCPEAATSDAAALGGDWVSFEGTPIKWADLLIYYNNTTQANKDALDLYMTAANAGTATKLSDIATLEAFKTMLDTRTAYDLSKVASTVNFKYYAGGVCYYNVPLSHDQRVSTKNGLGRWGVVRNNWYNVSVNTITEPGLPFIPDPTDPDIVDPANPDPIDPTTPDVINKFIDVSITMNDWTTWSQGVDL